MTARRACCNKLAYSDVGGGGVCVRTCVCAFVRVCERARVCVCEHACLRMHVQHPNDKSS